MDYPGHYCMPVCLRWCVAASITNNSAQPDIRVNPQSIPKLIGHNDAVHNSCIHADTHGHTHNDFILYPLPDAKHS
jgi:hypothetical protein